MSSPDAAPSGSPPVTASPPAASTTPPPTSSSTPSAPPPSLDQTPPPAVTPPPPSPAPISTSPPAPPPDSPPPPASTSNAPPPSSQSPPPPPPAATRSPPPPSQSPPPPNKLSSPPPQSPAPATQSPSPPDLITTPPPPTSSSPPPPKSTSSPTAPSTSSPTLSPPPPPTSASTPTTPSTSTTSSPPSPPSSPPTSISSSALAGILATGIVAAAVVLILVFFFCKKKKKRVMYYSGDHHHGPPGALPSHYQAGSYYDPMKQEGWHSPRSQSSDVLLNIPPPSPFGVQHDAALSQANSGGAQGMAHSKSWFTYAELATATNGFSNANLLGEGGFGCVYKGVLANGQVVAVKQLKTGASQGEKEFQAEVEIISRVHHRHLVSLVGYCIADSQRLLVYDYVANDTLEYHLHKRKGGPIMDWATRMKVASGAARGLAYLHEDCHPRIIHRDIKSANILLDNYFEAQVSDFGLAKLTLDTNTHVTTRVMGTFGYLAPEYASSGKLTEKSDVFSFGVVLLELLTGRKPVDISQLPGEESLVEWARPKLAQVESEEDLEMLVDSSLSGAYDPKEAMRMAEAAAACVRHSAHKRPRMGQVVRALEDEISLSDLAKGLRPGHSRVYGSSFSSTDYENGSYSADMRRFRMALNENNDTGGLVNPSGSSSEYQTSLEIDRNTRRPSRVSRATATSSNEFSTSH